MTGVDLGTRIAVITSCIVRLVGIRTKSGFRLATANVMALVEGRATNRILTLAGAGLTCVGLRAKVTVVTGPAVRQAGNALVRIQIRVAKRQRTTTLGVARALMDHNLGRLGAPFGSVAVGQAAGRR